MSGTRTWLTSLSADREQIGRESTATRVADVLRRRVSEGDLLPGTRLSEEEIGEALGVSRNTLREAFRLLTHERLVEHVFNRGVFVRSMTARDVRDLYDFRRVLECAAIRLASVGSDLEPMRAAVARARAAMVVEDWMAVGTANIHFHQALAALAGSARVDETMTQLLAELRLVFHLMPDPRRFHEPYIEHNQSLVDLLESGDLVAAERALSGYLDVARDQLLEVVGG